MITNSFLFWFLLEKFFFKLDDPEDDSPVGLYGCSPLILFACWNIRPQHVGALHPLVVALPRVFVHAYAHLEVPASLVLVAPEAVYLFDAMSKLAIILPLTLVPHTIVSPEDVLTLDRSFVLDPGF